jgi:hypothetical protein
MADFAAVNPIHGPRGRGAGRQQATTQTHQQAPNVTLRKRNKQYQKPAIDKAIMYKVRIAWTMRWMRKGRAWAPGTGPKVPWVSAQNAPAEALRNPRHGLLRVNGRASAGPTSV